MPALGATSPAPVSLQDQRREQRCVSGELEASEGLDEPEREGDSRGPQRRRTTAQVSGGGRGAQGRAAGPGVLLRPPPPPHPRPPPHVRGGVDRHCSERLVVGFDGAPGRFFFLEF